MASPEDNTSNHDQRHGALWTKPQAGEQSTTSKRTITDLRQDMFPARGLDQDLARFSCTRRLIILSTSALVEESKGITVSSDESSLILWLPSKTRLGNWAVVNGFQDLGVIEVAESEELAPFADDKIAHWLQEYMKLESEAASEIARRIVSHIHDRRRHFMNSRPRLQVAVSSMPVFTDTQLAEQHRTAAKDTRILWKWARPEGPYAKQGAWETALSKAVEHGEWNGGRGVMVFARCVSQTEWDGMRGRKVIVS